MKRVYISGRISGVKRERYLAEFARVEERLWKAGYMAVNPTRFLVCRWLWLYRLMGYRLTLLYDLWRLSGCDMVYMLPGWEKSRGSRIEYSWAKEMGIEVFSCEDCLHYYDRNPYGLEYCEREGRRLGHSDGICGNFTFLPMVVLAVMLVGCKSVKYVPVETIRTDTVYQARVERDSIFRHDSVWVNRYVKGDTVYMEKERWRTEWRDRWRTDTVYRSRTDSVAVPYPVERELSKWERWCLDYGKVTTGATGLLAVLLVVGLVTGAKRLLTEKEK